MISAACYSRSFREALARASSFSLLLVLLLLPVMPARAQETVPPTGSTLDCDADADGMLDAEPANDENPDWTDIVSDPASGYWAAAAFHDNSNTGFQYFALRLNGNPVKGDGTLKEFAWVALMQVPGGNQFQYQWLLNVSGNNEEVQIWENTVPKNIAFDPIFNDPAEGSGGSPNWSNPWTSGGPVAPNDPFGFSGALARVETADSSIDGNPDYLIFWAVPIAQLITLGIIADHTDLDDTLYFLATSANDNNYNKDHIDCPFGPSFTALDIDKQVTPNSIDENIPTPLTYTIDVTNTSATVDAQGIVITDDDFHSCMTFAAGDVTVMVPAPSVVTEKTVAAGPDLTVRVDVLEPGQTIAISIAAVANCPNQSITNHAFAFATNAPEVTDLATIFVLLPVELTAFNAQLDGRAVTLFWETASETNNAGFEIQQRYAGEAGGGFETLGWMEGRGTTNEPQRYRFSIEDLAPGRHTFRLKQLDYDGAFEYSPQLEVSVEMPEAFLLSEVYPNPFSGSASFSFGVRRAQAVSVDLFDVRGRRVLQLYQGVPASESMQALTIDGRHLHNGVYLLRVRGETFVESRLITLLR